MSNIVIMVGAPGSGKSTWVEKYKTIRPKMTFLSSDHLRSVFGTSENDQSVSHKVFRHMETEVDRLLSEGKDVCIDATNMHRKARKPWVDLARKHNACLEAYVFDVHVGVLLERNKKRGASGGRDVPGYVIERMLLGYVAPSREEGFYSVTFVKQ